MEAEQFQFLSDFGGSVTIPPLNYWKDQKGTKIEIVSDFQKFGF